MPSRELGERPGPANGCQQDWSYGSAAVHLQCAQSSPLRGYFSPQQFHRAGWSLNARTEPLKDWIVKLDGAVAFESVSEEAAREFPLLSEPGALIGGGTSSGAAGSLDLAMARQIGPDVIVSANIAVTASKAFEDLRAGIGFVWVPGGRAALVPSDLATDPFSPGSWIRP